MSSLSRIFGWTPSNNEDAEHVYIPPRPDPPRPSRFSIFTFQNTHSGGVRSGQSSPAGYEAASPASSTSSFSHDGGPQPDAEPLRRGDPEWVARPRNPFIIFRCEYSREHSKEGKRVRRPPGSQAEKTLSKRAAEAWHQLSAGEKNRFKELADRERDEHARLHPNYRFRPVKRNAMKKRPLQAHKLQPQPPTAVDPMVAPVPRYPLPPDTPELSPSGTMPSYPPLHQSMSVAKANRRRSASAPSLPFMQPPFARFPDTEFPRLRVKRSRSLMGNRRLPVQTGQASPYEDFSFDPGLLEFSSLSGEFYVGDDSLSSELGSVDLPFNDQFSNFGTPGPLSPLSVMDSSLAGWNGEPELNQVAPGCSPWSSVEVDQHQYAGYQNANPELAMAAGNYAPANDSWMTSSSSFQAPGNLTCATDVAGMMYARGEAERVYALQEYGLGLDMRTGEASTVGEEPIALLDSNRNF